MDGLDRLRATLRDAPVVDMGDYDYVVTPVTDGIPPVEPELLQEVVTTIAEVADVEAADKIVAPEAMGIHHATALSMETGTPFVVVRKRSYGLPGEVNVHQETGYAESELYVNYVDEGDRVVVVDDMFSTGGTLTAVCDALESIEAEILDAVTVLSRGDPAPDLPTDLAHLLWIDLQDGEVVVREEPPDDDPS